MIYVSVLTLLSVSFFLLACRGILNSQTGLFRSEARRAFDNAEKDLSGYIAQIDRYITRVYADAGLALDLELFLHSRSEETYLSLSLDKNSYSGIVDDLRDFAAGEAAPLFTQISLHNSTFANIITFPAAAYSGKDTLSGKTVPSGKSTVIYNAPHGDSRISRDITAGIPYVRKLVSPSRINSYIGEIRFVLSLERVFAGAAKYNVPGLAVTGAQDSGGDDGADGAGTGDSFHLVRGNSFSPGIYAGILAKGSDSGKYSAGSLNSVYYEVFTSGQYGYRMIAAKDLSGLLKENMQLFLLVFLAAAFIFTVILVILLRSMGQDAAFLNRIIGLIGRAKTGSFTGTETKPSRDNEYGLIYGELNDMCRKLDEHIRREYILKLRQKESEMAALQNQINPHFLYNTLEIIRSHALTGDRYQTADAISNLGKMYRGLVKDAPIITMERELELLRSYLELMEFRHGGGFCYQIDAEDSVLRLSTVKFWMQPLAENFFRHGYDKTSEYNLMIITGRETADSYIIEIVNNGREVSPERLAGLNRLFGEDDSDTADSGGGYSEPQREVSVGLRNVYIRLRYFYGEKMSMKLENRGKSGVSLVVTLEKGEGNAYVEAADSG